MPFGAAGEFQRDLQRKSLGRGPSESGGLCASAVADERPPLIQNDQLATR